MTFVDIYLGFLTYTFMAVVFLVIIEHILEGLL